MLMLAFGSVWPHRGTSVAFGHEDFYYFVVFFISNKNVMGFESPCRSCHSRWPISVCVCVLERKGFPARGTDTWWSHARVKGRAVVHKVNQLSRGNLEGEIERFLSSTPQRPLKYTDNLKCNLCFHYKAYNLPLTPRISSHTENQLWIYFPRCILYSSIEPMLHNQLHL